MRALLDYLHTYFLSEPQLLFRCGLAPERLAELQREGRAPLPSYRLRCAGAVTSYFGEQALDGELAWYPQAMAEWLIAADHADAATLRARFERRYRAELARLAEQGLPAAEPVRGLDEEWAHFLAGSYGVCTRHGQVEQIAAKGAMVDLIDRLTDRQTRPALPEPERILLRRAVDLLDETEAWFAPHERAASSRARCVDGVRRRYLGGEA
ncbi:DUF6058 family natural product biosynthesis protein [Chromobacterium violaceum]|uniref:Uncharacterized protein n=1 Tax=Chromobacterium violaceum TaxID=536 RepID=A0AAX2MFW3_CHRVL|nr:DUF6058 family natural product biosynthesis protein [Chromobacterium violaceum]OLZ85074.1 hypothetical protein BS642_03475 [Chromobacterium violaceum]STB69678.1 Uncharacterised protein [Chromobacterium violaceum]SUY93044.1 Uncharacterised protein [Chromobacterium violaceum]